MADHPGADHRELADNGRICDLHVALAEFMALTT